MKQLATLHFISCMDAPHKKQEVPVYVTDTHRSLQKAYTNVRQALHDAHQRNKSRYDSNSVNVPYQVGDQVWLYVPSVKSGNTKKLASLWRGPYTVIDRRNQLGELQNPIDQSAC